MGVFMGHNTSTESHTAYSTLPGGGGGSGEESWVGMVEPDTQEKAAQETKGVVGSKAEPHYSKRPHPYPPRV